jgi:thiol-disulfide isomerase/thioredoxin
MRKTSSKAVLRASVYALIAVAAAVVGVHTYLRIGESAAPDTAPAPVRADAAAPVGGTPPAGSAQSGLRIHDAPRALPEVQFTDGDWRDLTLAAFRGKVVLLNLWATWCGPCREEMPTLDRLQATLGGPDFQVVALSIDQEGIYAVQDFYEELGLEALEVYVDDSMRAASLLGAPGIPATLLIDRDGREIARKLGPAQWDSDEIIEQLRHHIGATAPPPQQ